MPKLEDKKAILYMASNHIGNIEDLPKRSIEVIKEADLLIVEEDKKGKELLKAAKVKTPFLKFNEHKQTETLIEVKKAFKQKKCVCYLSDQGSPTLCDPGFAILNLAYESQVCIKVIPGPSSLTAALSACPFHTEDFFFAGFLPRKPKERDDKIKELLKFKTNIVILETPYRRNQLLENFAKYSSEKRKAFLAMDISGTSEEYIYGSFKDLLVKSKNKEKCNFVLVLKKPRK